MGGTRGRGVVAVVAPRGRFLFFVVPHSGGVCGDGGKSSYSHQTRANKGRRVDKKRGSKTYSLYVQADLQRHTVCDCVRCVYSV